MSATDLSKIMIRILALFFILQGLAVLPTAVVIHLADPLWFIDQSLLCVIFGIILWLVADPLSRKMVSSEKTGEELNVSALSEDKIQQILIAMLGLILVVFSIPPIISVTKYCISPPPVDTISLEAQRAGAYGHLIKYFARLFLGFLLVAFPRQVARLLDGLRRKFTPKSFKSTPPDSEKLC